MIDLKDTTFIIPVRIDSSDRLRNLQTAIKYLFKYVETNVYIVEQDKEIKVPEKLATQDYVEYSFLQSNDPLFYKTLCINDAINFIKTKNIVIYDTDALIPIPQLEKLSSALETADCVYPYAGKFLDIPENMIPSVIESLFVENIDQSLCTIGLGMPEVTSDRQSFGGAVAFNRKKFIEGGCTNQLIVSYGPEDIEIYIRFKKLGYNIIRLDGPIFHLHHSRGMNSSDNHHRTVKNHEEFKKIMDMDPMLLRMFVDSWPWKRRIQDD